MDRDEVRLGQQVVELAELGARLLLHFGRRSVHVVVDHLHAEALGPAGEGLPDAAEPKDPDRLVVDVLAEHHHRAPHPSRAPPQESVAFGDPPCRRHNQREGRVGGGLGEHLGGVRAHHAAARARLDVDVVEANRVVRHDHQLRARGVEELVVDLVRQERDRAGLALAFGQQAVARHGRVALVQRHVAALRDPFHGRLRQPARDQHGPTFLRHAASFARAA